MRLLVTGVTGLVGEAVAGELLRRGHDVVRSARRPARVRLDLPVVAGDALTGEGLAEALECAEVAYYFVHSIHSAQFDVHGQDVAAAQLFVELAAAAGVRTLGYLGIHPISREASRHYRNRADVEQIIATATPTSFSLRAGLVLGPLSTAALDTRIIERSAIITLGSWRENSTALNDPRAVAAYLASAGSASLSGHFYDIPPAAVMTHEQLIRRMVQIAGKRRLIVRVPFDDRRLTARVVARRIGEPRHYVDSLMTLTNGDIVPQGVPVPITGVSEPRVEQSLRALFA